MSGRMTRSDKLRPVHHRAWPKSRSFQHYREGCLCHRCSHYMSCRIAQQTIAVQKPLVEEFNYPAMWFPKRSKISPAMRRILDWLRQHKEGGTVREIALALGISARHAFRCLKVLQHHGLVKKLWELRKERILLTYGRQQDTCELIHRYVIPDDKKC